MDDLSIDVIESTSGEQAVIKNVSENPIPLGKYAIVIDFEDGTVVEVPKDSLKPLLLKPSDEILLKTPGDTSPASSKYVAVIDMPRGFTLGDNPEVRLCPCGGKPVFSPPKHKPIKSHPPNPHITKPPPPPKENETNENSDLCEKCGGPLNIVGVCVNRKC